MELLKAFLVILSLSCIAFSVVADDKKASRLPRTSIPLSYDLNLNTKVHVNQRGFSGIVKISIEITQRTNEIVLHNRALTVKSVNLTAEDKSEVLQTHRFDVENDFMIIDVGSRDLLAGEKVSVEIVYSGFLQLDSTGFYRSSYRLGNDIR